MTASASLAADIILRRADFSLSNEQRSLRDSFAGFLHRECPTERVRASEPHGCDAALWQKLLDLEILSMGLDDRDIGSAAGLVELCLVAEQIGRYVAPVPFIDSIAAVRLLDRCNPAGARWLKSSTQGDAVVTLALDRAKAQRTQLVTSGAIAHAVIGQIGDEVAVVSNPTPPPLVKNQACSPLGLWDLTDPAHEREVLARGRGANATFEQAAREWKLLMAAAQVGIAESALQLAIEYARNRVAFDTPISQFQGVSHPLVDCHIAIVGARRLVWKAAWFADHEPQHERHLIPMAFVYASRTANRTTAVGVHTQGGLGVTLESDMQLFFRRAKGWANVAGDPTRELQQAADALYGSARS